MKISLVTVSYNSAATIEETIRSVLDQEGVEVEYIVVDAASKDGTPEIIRRYADRLAWWVSEPDRGQVDALNKGFTHATGDVLGFLNADDVLKPGTLKTVCERFAATPEAEIVYGGIEWIDFDGHTTGSHLGDISNLEEALDIYHVWWQERQWVQPEVFFRRSLKDRVGNFDERYHLAFDFDFWVRCFLAGVKVTRVPKPFVRFRRHPGQKSNAFERATTEIRSIVREHLGAKSSVGFWRRRELLAQLDYDIYQSMPPEQRPGFASTLASHPGWLLSPEVRGRLFASTFGRSRKATDT